MGFLKELFSEAGHYSLMRVMALLCCLTAIGIAMMGINKDLVDYSGLSLLVSAFLTAAMGGKIMQKRIEVSGAKSEVEVEKT